MSPRAARALALPFALIAAGLRVADKFWFAPLTWRLEHGAGFVVAIAGTLASAGLSMAAYLLLTRRARRGPAAFLLDGPGRRFVAPATPRWHGAWMVSVGWLAGNSIITERVPNQYRVRLTEVPHVAAFGASVAVAGLLLVTVLALEHRSVLTLSADGFVEQRTVRRKQVDWDRLLPGGPPPPATRNPQVLTLYTYAGKWLLTARDRHVDPAFLAHTIRTYADEPDRRAAIGTAVELAHLRATFTSGTKPPATSERGRAATDQ